MKAHLLFEQSGTFKNAFKKNGIEAFDYDILNDFGETDFQIDLFGEIQKAFEGGKACLITSQKEMFASHFSHARGLKNKSIWHFAANSFR